jgi:hypothetical protein
MTQPQPLTKEAVTVRLSEAIAIDLIAVLAHWTETFPENNLRAVSIHAQVEVLGATMRDAIAKDPERARRFCGDMLMRLADYLDPPAPKSKSVN